MSEDLIDCWIDCDPGHDDALAIILAAYSKKTRLIGVSTVAGNQTIEKTTLNTLKVLNIAGLVQEPEPNAAEDYKRFGLTFPVLQGAAKPILIPLLTGEDIFGESGLHTLSNKDLPSPPESTLEYIKKQQDDGVHFTSKMYQILKKSAKKVTVFAIGPLTNIAMLLLNHPDVGNYIEKLVIMGGAVNAEGNTNSVAEFNFYVDPHSASIVLNSGIEIYLVPLDATNNAELTSSVVSSMRSIGSTFSETIVDLLLFIQKTFFVKTGIVDPPFHDPVAVALVLDPSMFKYELLRLDIETQSQLSFGQTVKGSSKPGHPPANVHFCHHVHADKFWALMIDAIKEANLKSPLNH